MSADSAIAKLVEKQMRNWELARQQHVEIQRDREAKQVRDFVTISREIASGGAALARKLGQRLAWPVFDREILQHMAGDDHVRTRLYEKLDERDTNWIDSVLNWLIQGEFRIDDYFHRLSETILALTRQGPAIFLGRGIDLILPQDRGLRVRLLAPEQDRIAEYASRCQCDERTARAKLERIERERAEFLRSHFGKVDGDLTRFDLTLNLGRVSHDNAVELIVKALQLGGAVLKREP
jgi:cytidylate kinase